MAKKYFFLRYENFLLARIPDELRVIHEVQWTRILNARITARDRSLQKLESSQSSVYISNRDMIYLIGRAQHTLDLITL